MTRREQLAAIGAAVAIPLGFFVTGAMGLGGPIALVGVLAAFLLLWRLIPRFWSTLGLGALAGLISGVLVMGPGFRLAMRVVAITDPVRTPEFTLDGTFFILLFVGGILGSLGGVSIAFLRHGTGIAKSGLSLIVTVGIMVLLLASEGLRAEFLELGAGPWLNIPMFGLIVFLYATFAGWLLAKLQGRWVKAPGAEPVEVRA